MRLVEPASDAEIADVDLAMAASGIDQYGELLETWRVILNRPGLFAAYLPFLRAVAAPGKVEVALKEASALYVGFLNGCRYTVSHRYASARRNGLDDETLRLIVGGEWESLSPRWRAALRVTRDLTLAPATVPLAVEPQVVSGPVLEQVRAEFDAEEIVELAMSVSVWNALARFHRVMDLPFDMPRAPEGIEPR